MSRKMIKAFFKLFDSVRICLLLSMQYTLFSYHLHRNNILEKRSLRNPSVYASFLKIKCTSSIIKPQYLANSNLDEVSDFRESYSSNQNNELSIKNEIEAIIDYYLNSSIPIERMNPSFLIENSFLLSKSSYYEIIMDQKLSNCNTFEDIEKIEKADNYLRRFVNNERKMRSRLKLNYLLAGASSSRFEEAVHILSECNEIDDSLLQYTKSLIQKEYQRVLGPTAYAQQSEDNSQLNIEDDSNGNINHQLNGYTSTTDKSANDENNILQKLSETGAKVIDVLTQIYNRLEAELKMKDKSGFRLLSQLLYENNPEKREVILRSSFQRVEEMEEFEIFLKDGIQYISSDNNENMSKENQIRKNQNSKKPIASIGTLEKMQDIQYLLNNLKMKLITGLKEEDDIFSTVADDYISNSDNDQVSNEHNLDESKITTSDQINKDKSKNNDNKWSINYIKK